tara:strand:+ start:2300 stop:3586 length:1287 start_codon:yes stop_codon:yes gene_type:complete
MASTIIIKNGTSSQSPTSLVAGELGINTTTGTLFYGTEGVSNKVSSSFTFSRVSSSGAIYMSQSAGTGNNVVIRDTSGKLITDVIDGAVWGATGAVLTTQMDEVEIESTATAPNWTVGIASTATTATTATNVTATANNTANETVYLTHVDGVSGGQGIETDTGLTYNPASNYITASGGILAQGTAGIYADKIRRASDSSTTTLIKLNDEHVKIYAGSNTAEAIGVQNQAVKVSGSLHVESPTGGHITASGDISSSGAVEASTVTAGSFIGTPIILEQLSIYATSVNGSTPEYRCGSGAGIESGNWNANIGDREAPTANEALHGLLLPFKMKNISLKATARSQAGGAPALWLYTGSRVNGTSNYSVGWAASASCGVVGSGNGAYNIDITGSLAFDTRTEDDTLFLYVSNQTAATDTFRITVIIYGEKAE